MTLIFEDEYIEVEASGQSKQGVENEMNDRTGDQAVGEKPTMQEEHKQNAWHLNFSLEETARLVCEAALEALDCPFDAQVCLTITDSENIRRMNREFRGIDSPTDVLSFPLTDLPAPGDFSELEAYADSLEQEEFEQQEEAALPDVDDLGDCFDSDTGELLLGDIVINLDRVFSQAMEYGHSTRREYAFLIAHSMLHLMGFDHMEPDEAKEMEERQEAILRDLGIRRE